VGFVSLPRIEPEYEAAERDARQFWRAHVPIALLTAAAAFLPGVRQVSGIRPWPFLLALTAHLLMHGAQVTRHLGRDFPRGFGLLACTVNSIACAIPAASTGRPATLLWLLYFLYPVLAAQAFHWNLVVLVVFALVPFGVAFVPWALTGLVPFKESAGPALVLTAVTTITYAMLGTTFATISRFRRERRSAEREAAAQAERHRVARDLHATLGAALSEVTLWTDLAAVAEAPRAAEALARASARAREALEELRTTVHGLVGEEVSPEALEGRLRRRLTGLCEAGTINLSLSVKGTKAIAAIRAYHLQKLVEEACVNAVRHARPAALEVELALQPLEVKVADDGCGFDPAAAPRGHGLGALAAHATALDLELSIRSAPGRGTEIRAGTSTPGGRIL